MKKIHFEMSRICEFCFAVFLSIFDRRFCSITCSNRSRKGNPMSEEQKKQIGLSNSGSNSHWWKGGVSPSNKWIRQKYEYKLWRKKVFVRDNYACVLCSARSQKGQSVILQADHIKPFFLYPDLRFSVDNGRTLCIGCHRKTPSYLNPYYHEDATVPN